MKLAERALGPVTSHGGLRTKAAFRLWLMTAVIVGCSPIAHAQTPAIENDPAASVPKTQSQPPVFSPGPVDLKSLPKNLFVDQKNFWLAP